MNKKALIITIGAVLLVGIGAGVAIHYYNKNKKEKEGETETEDDEPTAKELKDLIDEMAKAGGSKGNPDATETSILNPLEGDNVLKIGSNGRKVAMLQALLNHYTGAKLKIDGNFGDKTREAVYKTGNLSCATTLQKASLGFNAAKTCGVSAADFLSLLNRTKTDPTFAQKYASNRNNDMKAVYEKYSSVSGCRCRNEIGQCVPCSRGKGRGNF